MPSVKNPNGPSKNRLAARLATARKHSSKQIERKVRTQQHKITGADSRRGARPGILPTSGPNRALGGKQQRKLERKVGYAIKRRMEADGEVDMKDASDETNKKSKKKQDKTEKEGTAATTTTTEQMAVDTDIS